MYSEYRLKGYTSIFNMLDKMSGVGLLTPLPIVELREEVRSLIIEDKDVQPADFILSFSKLSDCGAAKYKLSYSLEVAGKLESDTIDFCDATTTGWNYTKVFSRGKDLKALDNGLHDRSINVIIHKKTFFG